MSTDKEIHGNAPSVGMNCNFVRMLVDIGFRGREIQTAKVIDLGLCAVLKILIHGGMAEWSKAAVLKTVSRQRDVGSNPTPSAIKSRRDFIYFLAAADAAAMFEAFDSLNKNLWHKNF
jgi:hypothetical protein